MKVMFTQATRTQRPMKKPNCLKARILFLIWRLRFVDERLEGLAFRV